MGSGSKRATVEGRGLAGTAGEGAIWSVSSPTSPPHPQTVHVCTHSLSHAHTHRCAVLLVHSHVWLCHARARTCMCTMHTEHPDEVLTCTCMHKHACTHTSRCRVPIFVHILTQVHLHMSSQAHLQTWLPVPRGHRWWWFVSLSKQRKACECMSVCECACE